MNSLNIIDFGFEIEIFACDQKDKKIFNAVKLIKDYLHVEKLTPNFYGNPTLITIPNYYSIISDGTPFEIVGIKKACEESMIRKEAAPSINIYLNNVRQYLKILFGVDTLLTPFADNKEYEFIDPGTVYSSGKHIHNAYTGRSRHDKKKEPIDKLVSFRTAGFHIHIRFKNKESEEKMFKGVYAPHKCNELIKELDKVYDNYFPKVFASNPELFKKEKLRNEQFAIKGDYRIKFHNHGQLDSFSTLEYRQFSAAFFTLEESIQSEILHDFAATCRKFVKQLKS
jgi:hypothetical protein